jgi:FkbM family methyltransferase
MLSKYRKWAGKIRYYYCRMSGAEEVRVNGLTLYINRREFGDHMYRLVCSGRYENREAEIVKTTLSPDDRLLDLGGGIGVVALTAARCLEPFAVTTVEANPALIPVIERNAHKNGLQINVRHAAVSDKNGRERIHLHQDFWASSLGEHARDGGEATEVPAVSFADLIEEVRPTYLSMDIEGAEIQLLKAFKRSTVRKICLEIHPKITGPEPIAEMLAGLTASGYKLDEVRSKKNILYLC